MYAYVLRLKYDTNYVNLCHTITVLSAVNIFTKLRVEGVLWKPAKSQQPFGRDQSFRDTCLRTEGHKSMNIGLS